LIPDPSALKAAPCLCERRRSLDRLVDESNPVRVIDVFVDTLDLAGMSFEGVEPPFKWRSWRGSD
jgi:hypothetical protein